MEDHAYALLGLFGVTLPVIHGKGSRSAFYRLQVEVFRATTDQSIFAWAYWDSHKKQRMYVIFQLILCFTELYFFVRAGLYMKDKSTTKHGEIKF